MKLTGSKRFSRALPALAALAVGISGGQAVAVEPCLDFGECKVLVEINATDGDIGFHFLMDGDDLVASGIRGPNLNNERKLLFWNKPFGPLRDQTLTEIFAESAEPLCWPDPDADEDEEIVTLEEFLDLWDPGIYTFWGKDKDHETVWGKAELSFGLPAAPAEVDMVGGVISWEFGDDLGRCADFDELDDLVLDGVLPIHPVLVPVAVWEVVLEPDFDDEEELELAQAYNNLKFTVRVPGSIASREVAVPVEYLDALPENTPVKIEVGAIAVDDNATFSEVGDFCVNEVDEGCESEEDEEEDDDSEADEEIDEEEEDEEDEEDEEEDD